MFMPYSKNPNLPKVRAEAVKMLRAGHSTRAVARHFGFSQSVIVKWNKKVAPDFYQYHVIATESSRPMLIPRNLTTPLYGVSLSYVKTPGAVQVLTAIKSKDAPEVYDSSLGDLPKGAKVQASANGGFVAIDAQGQLITASPKPWAHDANGKVVKTYFKVDGQTMKQYVSHKDANVAYPVTIDPTYYYWWGVNVQLNKRQTADMGLGLAWAAVAGPVDPGPDREQGDRVDPGHLRRLRELGLRGRRVHRAQPLLVRPVLDLALLRRQLPLVADPYLTYRGEVTTTPRGTWYNRWKEGRKRHETKEQEVAYRLLPSHHRHRWRRLPAEPAMALHRRHRRQSRRRAGRK